MPSKLKFFPEKDIGVLKFTGEVDIGEIVDLLAVTYESPEYKQISHSLLDFRKCSFAFDYPDIVKAVEVVQKYRHVNQFVKTALIVSKPKETALAKIFQMKLGIPEKVILIKSDLSQIISMFDLNFQLVELEDLIKKI